jgi:sulfur carrier protein ThiS
VADTQGTTYGTLLEAFRALPGSVAVTWDNHAVANSFWTNEVLDNVRVDVTLTGGSAANAYLLVWDGTSTFEIIKGGFFAKYVGNTIEGDNGLNKVSSLTFGATAPGTYIVKIAINQVDGTTGAVKAYLAEQTLTFTVAAAPAE